MPETTRRCDPQDSALSRRAATAVQSSAPSPDWSAIDLDDAAQRRFGDYELLEELGRGGMGVVFRARQQSLGREIAIKFMLVRESGATGSFRLREEARIAARLHHPGIVPVFEFGVTEALHYFTMPLMRGRTLADTAALRRPSVSESVRLLVQVAEAVGYAHDLGLLHLDLKPANILLDEAGRPLIADFGLARPVDASGRVTAIEVSGTPAFMAPEQAQGSGAVLTRATDVFALGATLHQLLTGLAPRAAGGGGGVESVRSINPRLPADLAAICDRCLEHEPAKRYPDAAALARDLLRFIDGFPVQARPLGPVAQLGRLALRHKAPSALAGLVALAVLAGTMSTTLQWQRAERARQLAEARAGQMIELAKRLAATHPSAGITPQGVCFGDLQRAEGVRFVGKQDCVSLTLEPTSP